MIDKPTIIDFKSIGDSTIGFISVAEEQDKIPFKIKRVYWTYYTPNDVTRGNHAHKKLQQVIVAVSGVIKFIILDKFNNQLEFTLDSPAKGLFLPKGYWREIIFSHNAVLLCIASEEYQEEDYIRSLEDFLISK